MQAGKILVANQGGAHLIKLTGDVRVTLCADFDDYIERMFSAGNFVSVLIDLSEAEGIDSTSLGLLARVAIETRRRYQLNPVMISIDPSITRLVESMGFASYFDLRNESPDTESELSELPHVACDDAQVREKVLLAHRVLMGLCDTNKAKFSQLVTALEAAS